jgi:ribosomal protein S18 acetylase RimI-like enzyme
MIDEVGMNSDMLIRNAGSGDETLLWLWVLESNTRAVEFYEKSGYEWIGMHPSGWKRTATRTR